MANPFDQFDELPAPEQGAAPTAPGPMAQAPEAPAQPNAFDGYAQDTPPPEQPRMTQEAWESEFYNRMRRGDKAEDILAWSQSTPFKLTDNMNFRRNIMIRDEGLAKGFDPALGRINNLAPGETSTPNTLDDAGTIMRRMANQGLFNFGDEAASAIRATVGGGDGSWFDRYERSHREMAELTDLEDKVSPGAAAVGDALGIGASMFVPLGVVDKGAKALPKVLGRDPGGMTAKMLSGAAAGTVYGGVAATGTGTPQDRFKDTPTGAALGAAFGTAFPLAEAAIRRVGRPIMERLSPNNAKALADRTALTEAELNAIEAELRRQQDLGLDPTLLDVLPERARRVVGSAGRRDGARETLRDFAEDRVTQLPERVARVADEEIRPAGVTGTDEEMQRAIMSQRDTDIEAALDPIRMTPLPMDDEILSILGTDVGQQAINNIIREMPDAARRQAYMELSEQAKQAARGVDPRLGEAQQQAAQEQLRSGTNFDLDMSERIGRELNRMAAVGEGSPGLRQMGRRVRSAAEQSPVYREAMTNYAAASRASDAVTVGSGRATMMDEAGRIQRLDDEGGGFLNEDPERFAQRFNELLDSPEMRNVTTDIPVKGSLEVRKTDDYDDAVSVAYTSESGERVAASISFRDNGETAYINIIGSPATWASSRGTFGADVLDMMRAFKREFPNIKQFKGDRVTGARADNSNRAARDVYIDREDYYDVEDQLSAVVQDGPVDPGELATRLSDLTPGQLRAVEQKLENKVQAFTPSDNYAASEAQQTALRVANDMLTEFRRLAGERLTNAPRGPRGGTKQVVRAPATQRTTSEPRVRIATGEEAVPPAEQARFQRERAAFDEETARRAQGFGGLTEQDVRIDDQRFVDIVETLESYLDNGLSLNLLRESLDNISAPELIAARNKLRQNPSDSELLLILEDVAGSRIGFTESRIAPPLTEPTPPTPVPVTTPAPDQRSLARLGAANQVGRAARQSPEAARNVARQIVRSPAQRQRTATMLGNRAAGRLQDRMAGEVNRVTVARAQASPEGPGRDGLMDGMESGVNVMYNPTSPISWIRESARYLSRLGMTDETAEYIVNNAIDPARTQEMIQLLRKQGMAQEQAEAWLAQFRDSLTKYSVTQEGNPYDAQTP